jgi:hypothetical protein
VHVSAPGAPPHPPLLTQGHTTSAAVHAARGPEVIQLALVDQALAPTEPRGAGASIDAALLLTSQQAPGRTRRGPTRPLHGWPTQVAGA